MAVEEVMTIDLDALDALCAAATSGPWEVCGQSIDGPDYKEVIRKGPVDCMAYCYGGSSTIEGDNLAADMAFCAAARTALPALIAEVRRLRKQLQERHTVAAQPFIDAERAAVVAWLNRRRPQWLSFDARDALKEAVDDIESAAHIKEP